MKGWNGLKDTAQTVRRVLDGALTTLLTTKSSQVATTILPEFTLGAYGSRSHALCAFGVKGAAPAAKC